MLTKCWQKSIIKTTKEAYSMARYYLGIDQGTTLTTAVLTDENWNVVSKASVPHRTIILNPAG